VRTHGQPNQALRIDIAIPVINHHIRARTRRLRVGLRSSQQNGNSREGNKMTKC
jgi:hypothetical protein